MKVYIVIHSAQDRLYSDDYREVWGVYSTYEKAHAVLTAEAYKESEMLKKDYGKDFDTDLTFIEENPSFCLRCEIAYGYYIDEGFEDVATTWRWQIEQYEVDEEENIWNLQESKPL